MPSERASATMIMHRCLSVSRQFFRLVLLLCCCWLLTGPQLLLQLGAWSWMVANYSQESSIEQAFFETFGGERPCDLCKIITAVDTGTGKRRQQRADRNQGPETSAWSGGALQRCAQISDCAQGLHHGAKRCVSASRCAEPATTTRLTGSLKKALRALYAKRLRSGTVPSHLEPYRHPTAFGVAMLPSCKQTTLNEQHYEYIYTQHRSSLNTHCGRQRRPSRTRI